MTIKIENNKLVGKWVSASQFLHGSADCRQYPITVDFTGADVNEVCRRAFDAAIIVYRKKVKNKAQAEAAGKGVKFEDMISRTRIPVDPETFADNLDPEDLSDEVRQRLLAKLMNRETGDNQQG
jgi:ATP-dependent protease HslVU (ClpYQ) ATPase subunit